MNDIQYRAFLDLLMCSDPWPVPTNQQIVESIADDEAVKRGYPTWVEAYHKMKPVKDKQ